MTKNKGLSVFGILNKCKTQVGKQMMRKWFLRPLQDQKMLNDRLKTVEYFLKPSSKDLQAALLNNLKKFKDLPRILTRIRAVSTSVTDWCNLFEVHFA